jgi:pyridoxal 5'-phosphate synthase pdxS subunit
MAAVTIPVMAKVRIGHFVEAQIIEAVGVDYIDESEVLTPADEELHINKHKFKVRKICGHDNSTFRRPCNHPGRLLLQQPVLMCVALCAFAATQVPFVCGCRNLGEALRRIDEGASMIRTKGEAGTGNVVEAVRHARAVHREIKQLCSMDEDELFMFGAVFTRPSRVSCIATTQLNSTQRPIVLGPGAHSCDSLCSQAAGRFVRAGQEDQGDGPPPGR